MNGHGPSEELEEVVIHDPQRAQRKSKEEPRSPAPRKYPKGGSEQVDALQNRPLLHAKSEPTSRLQVTASVLDHFDGPVFKHPVSDPLLQVCMHGRLKQFYRGGISLLYSST